MYREFNIIHRFARSTTILISSVKNVKNLNKNCILIFFKSGEINKIKLDLRNGIRLIFF